MISKNIELFLIGKNIKETIISYSKINLGF